MSRLTAALVASLLCLSVAQAQDKKPADKPAAAEKATTSQQDKMGDCNKEAAEKKLSGEERKKFMSDCLSSK